MPTEDAFLNVARSLEEQKIPNFFRLYLNPWVAQACLVLSDLSRRAADPESTELWPVFLANSFEESLSGAIKLARYTVNSRSDAESSAAATPPTAIIVDPDDALRHFESTDLQAEGSVVYLPGVLRIGSQDLDRIAALPPAAIFVVVGETDEEDPVGIAGIHRLAQSARLTIRCLSLRNVVPDHGGRRLPADIVVFDETFVGRQVPFGAFSARAAIYSAWMRRGMSMFHSTTYQPNSVSSMQLLEHLRSHLPDALARLTERLRAVGESDRECALVLKQIYSPSLVSLMRKTGFLRGDVTAAGSMVAVGPRRILDGVAGVACSIRGHNPPGWCDAIRSLPDAAVCREELGRRLTDLTGLAHVVPAVSGASAVEHALKLALCAAAPRRRVIAFRGGFGGKTLLSLTGTWKAAYRTHLQPLYDNVTWVDPFAVDAPDRVRHELQRGDVAVVQLELIQGVGGVRPVPRPLLDVILKERSRQEFLVFVDEVQTGMYRTGPFLRSTELGITPDLVTLGKGTSDMIFPFALTLYSDRVARSPNLRETDIEDTLNHRYGMSTGYKCVLQTLRRAEAEGLEDQVRESGQFMNAQLRAALAGCPAVHEIRTFGMLIGIELDRSSLPHRCFGRLASQLYLLGMLNHSDHPLLMGFCQYEPHIFKLTPSLNVSREEMTAMCGTIGDVLRQGVLCVAAGSLRSLLHRRSETVREDSQQP